MDKMIILAVGGVVAVGTVLYYLLTKEKPMQTRSRPSDRPSSPRPRSPPVSYSDVKPEPCRKRKSIPEKGSSKEKILETSFLSGPDKESGKNSEMNGSSDPIPAIIVGTQDDAQSSQEITDNSYPIISNVECRVCDEPANATFIPCKHQVFCEEHAKYYFDIAKKNDRTPRCPSNDCREVLKYFTV